MPQSAKTIAELEALDVPQTKPPDFDAFWADAMKRCAEVPLNVKGDMRTDVRDLTFEGLDGTPVHTWLLLPPEAKNRKVPAVVYFHGAGRDRGKPQYFTPWLEAGCAVISCDFRMQRGATGSNTAFDDSMRYGWRMLNISDLKNSWLYCVQTDCLRAVRLARETPELDPLKIAVDGISQGGGMALGVAALDRSVSLCMADVPSSCWMEQRLRSRSGGAAGAADYLNDFPERAETVRRNLSYFDNINLAPDITCPVLVSCGLLDTVCPPECVYAAYNKIRSAKAIAVYPQAGHEGGGPVHLERKLEFLRQNFGK
ncbi:MAG: acetylxylan esterase [Kiritimatiellales bacterium]|jgi:cephalosporin-C deacetylase